MKKILIFITLIFAFSNLYSQDKKFLSAEIEGSSHYYFMPAEDNIHLYFNYGTSFSVAMKYEQMKMGLGINYSTKNAYQDHSWDRYRERTEYTIKYIGFLLSGTYDVYSSNKLNVNCLAGFLYKNSVQYDIAAHRTNITDLTDITDRADKYDEHNVYLRLGAGISKPISSNFNLNLLLFFDYKIMQDIDNSIPTHYWRPDLPGDRFSMGLKLGIEYAFIRY